MRWMIYPASIALVVTAMASCKQVDRNVREAKGCAPCPEARCPEVRYPEPKEPKRCDVMPTASERNWAFACIARATAKESQSTSANASVVERCTEAAAYLHRLCDDVSF